MIDRPLVDIIMGTFNGAEFLAKQIESLRAQTHQNWHLLIRDDGSQDGTVSLVAEFLKMDPRIELVVDNLGNLGCNQNYHHMLGLSKSRYVMYCDQDDVWLPQKIELTLNEMQRCERNHPGKPVLVHCDAVVTDAHLSVIKERFIGGRGNRSGLPGLLFANCVQGAAAMMNAPLRDLVLRAKPPLPYDYHSALIASAFGIRSYLNRALLLYRQHSRNLIGAGAGSEPSQRSRISPTLELALRGYENICKTFECFKRELPTSAKKDLHEFEQVLFGKSTLKRLYLAVRNRYGFYRRRDRLNLLLYICHIYNI